MRSSIIIFLIILIFVGSLTVLRLHLHADLILLRLCYSCLAGLFKTDLCWFLRLSWCSCYCLRLYLRLCGGCECWVSYLFVLFSVFVVFLLCLILFSGGFFLCGSVCCGFFLFWFIGEAVLFKGFRAVGFGCFFVGVEVGRPGGKLGFFEEYFGLLLFEIVGEGGFGGEVGVFDG